MQRLACPQCGPINRLDPSRPTDAPDCGRCRTALAPSTPIALDEATLPGYLANTGSPMRPRRWDGLVDPLKPVEHR